MNGAPTTVFEVLRGDFARRASAPELMDDPHSDPHRLERTLSQFASINRLFSRYRRVLARRLPADAAAAGLTRFSVLDVGGGGGDIARRLVADAARQGMQAEVTVLESDPRVAAFARRACASEPRVTIQEGSAFALPLAPYNGAGSEGAEHGLSATRHDYVICNHLLHHFSDEQLPELLQRMTAAARRRVIANDLLRARSSAVAFAAIAALFYPGGFAAFDGALSVQKGFRPAELRQTLERAGLAEFAEVYTLPPGRVVLEVYLPGAPRVRTAAETAVGAAGRAS